MKYLLRTALTMARYGDIVAPIKEICERIYSNETSMILRRDMREQVTVPGARLSLAVRRLEARDYSVILRERPRRLPILRSGIPTCYIVTTNCNEIAFMLWVIVNTDWLRFKPYFKGEIHRRLQPDECLFEFAYTFKKFRGNGVMGAALVMIAQEVVKERPSVRWAYNYVRLSNEASLRGCRNAGFRPYMRRTEHWRAMRFRQEFVSLDAGALFPFEEIPEQQMLERTLNAKPRRAVDSALSQIENLESLRPAVGSHMHPDK
jgi:hypothetical protein